MYPTYYLHMERDDGKKVFDKSIMNTCTTSNLYLLGEIYMHMCF